MVRLFERKKTYNSTKKDAGVRYVEGKIEQTKKAAMVFFFAVAAFLSAWYKFVSPLEKPFHKTLNQTAKGTKATIVIDPGHGGCR